MAITMVTSSYLGLLGTHLVLDMLASKMCILANFQEPVTYSMRVDKSEVFLGSPLHFQPYATRVSLVLYLFLFSFFHPLYNYLMSTCPALRSRLGWRRGSKQHSVTILMLTKYRM